MYSFFFLKTWISTGCRINRFNFQSYSTCHATVYLLLREIIVYFRSIINVYSLLSYEWWVPLIKFMMKPTIHVRGRSTYLWYSRNTLLLLKVESFSLTWKLIVLTWQQFFSNFVGHGGSISAVLLPKLIKLVSFSLFLFLVFRQHQY